MKKKKKRGSVFFFCVSFFFARNCEQLFFSFYFARDLDGRRLSAGLASEEAPDKFAICSLSPETRAAHDVLPDLARLAQLLLICSIYVYRKKREKKRGKRTPQIKFVLLLFFFLKCVTQNNLNSDSITCMLGNQILSSSSPITNLTLLVFFYIFLKISF